MVLKCATIISSTSESSHIISGPGSKVGWGDWNREFSAKISAAIVIARKPIFFVPTDRKNKSGHRDRNPDLKKSIFGFFRRNHDDCSRMANLPTHQPTNHGVSSIKLWFPQWRSGWKVRILSIHFLLTVTYPGNSRFGIRRINLRINVQVAALARWLLTS